MRSIRNGRTYPLRSGGWVRRCFLTALEGLRYGVFQVRGEAAVVRLEPPTHEGTYLPLNQDLLKVPFLTYCLASLFLLARFGVFSVRFRGPRSLRSVWPRRSVGAVMDAVSHRPIRLKPPLSRLADPLPVAVPADKTTVPQTPSCRTEAEGRSGRSRAPRIVDWEVL